MLSAWIRNFALFGFFLAVLLNQAFGSKAAALFLAFAFVAIGWRKHHKMVPMDAVLLWGLFSVLALVSTFWSLQPEATLRGAFQFTLCNVLVILSANYFSMRSFYLAAGAALFVTLSLSILFPTTGMAPGIGGSLELVNVGLFGSKNQYGLAAAFALMFGPFITFGREKLFVRLFGLALIAVGLIGISQAVSYGASVVAIVTLGATIALWVFSKAGVTRPARFLVFIFGGSTMICFVLVLFGYWDEILSYFGKDATLTGRTELWSAGVRAVEENPILGVGFQGFWRVGNPEAEALMAQLGMSTRVVFAFNFHNQIFDVWVQLGLLGVLLFVLVVVRVLHDMLVIACSKFDAYYACALSVCIFLLSRCFIESSILSQFNFAHLMFVGATFYLAVRAESELRDNSERRNMGFWLLRRG